MFFGTCSKKHVFKARLYAALREAVATQIQEMKALAGKNSNPAKRRPEET